MGRDFARLVPLTRDFLDESVGLGFGDLGYDVWLLSIQVGGVGSSGWGGCALPWRLPRTWLRKVALKLFGGDQCLGLQDDAVSCGFGSLQRNSRPRTLSFDLGLIGGVSFSLLGRLGVGLGGLGWMG